MNYEIHPLADVFPMMSEDAFNELRDDIAANGQREPIWLYEGKVLDGRNRLLACRALELEPKVSEYDGDDPIGFTVSLNLHRRHLTASQLAFVALEIEKAEAALAHERMVAGRAPGPMTQMSQGPARKVAAEKIGVAETYVSDAKRIAREAPELADAIKSGAKTITQAKRELKEAAREERRSENRSRIESAPTPIAAARAAKFATIVIDPPWDWGDEGDADQLGRARPTYGTMPFAELLALPVETMADIDCHLYLWITNRSLPKGFQLLKAWGFRYVTCLTWCKPSIGMGNYFRGSTEHILFGVRGSQPLKRKDVGTWFSAPRGPRGHSSKPADFYALAESCSPGPYLEMFARGGRTGWTSWGAEADAA